MSTIFHTADVHLDAPFTFLGRNGQRQRQQVKDTFKAFVDRAIGERCDLILIAGDLFDSNSPSQSTLDFAVAQLRRLSIPVCILPGTHDCYSQRSVYRRTNFSGLCPHVFVFTDGQGEQKEYPDLGLTVHARANLTNQSPVCPLEGLAKRAETRWNVAMAHGSVVIPGRTGAADFPIYPEQIASSAMDYVALGHWHSFGDYSQRSVPAYYCGCPETISFDGAGSGHFVRVALSDAGRAQVTEERIGRRSLASLAVPMDGVESVEEVKSLILARSDPDLMLAVTLTGLKEAGFAIDAGDFAADLGEAFFHLRVADESHAKLKDLSVGAFQEKTVVGQFVRIMQARITEASSPQDARLAEDALQLGIALLQGKEVLA